MSFWGTEKYIRCHALSLSTGPLWTFCSLFFSWASWPASTSHRSDSMPSWGIWVHPTTPGAGPGDPNSSLHASILMHLFPGMDSSFLSRPLDIRQKTEAVLVILPPPFFARIWFYLSLPGSPLPSHPSPDLTLPPWALPGPSLPPHALLDSIRNQLLFSSFDHLPPLSINCILLTQLDVYLTGRWCLPAFEDD